MQQIAELKTAILDVYKSEAACSRHMGWQRQRLNKITTGSKEPSIYELNEIANALNLSVSNLMPLFLQKSSPNRQHKLSGTGDE